MVDVVAAADDYYSVATIFAIVLFDEIHRNVPVPLGPMVHNHVQIH